MHLSLALRDENIRRHGVVQLFEKSHPRRRLLMDELTTKTDDDLKVNDIIRLTSVQPLVDFNCQPCGSESLSDRDAPIDQLPALLASIYKIQVRFDQHFDFQTI